MAVAERLERLARKQLVGGLGLLQAQDVGLHLGKEPGDVVGPQADGIDVPGNQAKGHGGLAWVGRGTLAQNLGA